MRKMLMTIVQQFEVKVLSEKDAPETYAKNLPPGGNSKWELIEYPDGQRLWHPKHSYTFSTPKITDFTGVTVQVLDK